MFTLDWWGKKKFKLALQHLKSAANNKFHWNVSAVSDKKLVDKLTTSAEWVCFTRFVQISHKDKSIFLTKECNSQWFQKTRKMRFETSNNIPYTVSQFVRHRKPLHVDLELSFGNAAYVKNLCVVWRYTLWIEYRDFWF